MVYLVELLQVGLQALAAAAVVDLVKIHHQEVPVVPVSSSSPILHNKYLKNS
jgi:hypothetical protein